LQRWSVRRVLLALGVVVGVLFTAGATASMFTPAHDIGLDGDPECAISNEMILFAQSVPSATAVPCVATMPAGWRLGGLSGTAVASTAPAVSGTLDGALHSLEHLRSDLRDSVCLRRMRTHLLENLLFGVGFERRVTAGHHVTTRE